MPTIERMSGEIIKRDPQTGQILKGSRSLNPGGRSRGLRQIIDEIAGDDAHEAMRLLWQLAQGEIVIEKLARAPAPHEDALAAAQIPMVYEVPDFKTRFEAVRLLLAYRHGQPKASVDVTSAGGPVNGHRIDPSVLPDDQLEKLESLLTGAVVDAEFKETKP